MSNLNNELLKDKIVALRIAVPGEPVTQHNGRVADIDDSTITILNTVEGSADLLVTVYNLKYVVLVQFAEQVEVPVVAEVLEEKPVAKKSK
jgi:hypothetical protein